MSSPDRRIETTRRLAPVVAWLGVACVACVIQSQAFGQIGPSATAQPQDAAYRTATAQPAAPPAGGVAPAAPVGPPFPLLKLEQQFVQQVLSSWEDASSQIKTFNTEFERLEYHPAWFSDSVPMLRCRGRLSYSKPDRGMFKVEQIWRWKNTDPKLNDATAPGDYQLQKNEVGEHWVCDGKSVFQYDHLNRQLNVTPLPPEMQGQNIVEGPLPFLFGAKADSLMRRYWMRSPRSDAAEIWLVAYPRWQADAANYHHVEVILDRKTMQPKALQVHQPDGNERHAYVFQSPTVNGALDSLFGDLFSAPRTPLGWKRVVVEAPPQAAQTPDGRPLQR
ncbi:MAG: TIGR03009 domain-containing protein [Planctomycetales bacterium]|nr:TIGR03009 domain-containing protein [Planctomycetales bacterium]